jgi:hypothetical protein
MPPSALRPPPSATPPRRPPLSPLFSHIAPSPPLPPAGQCQPFAPSRASSGQEGAPAELPPALSQSALPCSCVVLGAKRPHLPGFSPSPGDGSGGAPWRANVALSELGMEPRIRAPPHCPISRTRPIHTAEGFFLVGSSGGGERLLQQHVEDARVWASSTLFQDLFHLLFMNKNRWILHLTHC